MGLGRGRATLGQKLARKILDQVRRGNRFGGWVWVCHLLGADCQCVALMLWPDLLLSQVFP